MEDDDVTGMLQKTRSLQKKKVSQPTKCKTNMQKRHPVVEILLLFSRM